MKIALKLLGLMLFFCAGQLIAQVPGNVMMSESDEDSGQTIMQDPPTDDITDKRTIETVRILPYDPVREADIFWEKRIWRVIDIREKMNLPFAYPERPFFQILQEAAENEEINVYSVEDDKFTHRLSPEEVASMGASVDTVTTFDPVTYEEKIQVVRNELNPSDIKRYRIKEVWFFDEETSTMQVRILGIAPLLDVKDENGNFKYEQLMFWVYYPEARQILAREKVFTVGNDAAPITWESLLEMRYFSSYIFKESNVHNRRLSDYVQGVDLLMEADKIKQTIFNFEHDLWEY
ncbi:MAG: gliding motility protein GldN [Bacteroidetes bacterium]|nr:MAG: gliding motility protein GldN [Bacteroidota bacterium]PTM11506.1 MAG: gliding motility protein GldN [Bacteroidota bacterium]